MYIYVCVCVCVCVCVLCVCVWCLYVCMGKCVSVRTNTAYMPCMVLLYERERYGYNMAGTVKTEPYMNWNR